ncbi:MAG: ATP-binding protein [Ruminococcus sp.]|nr:ATP-binding protein [Ruminococcus sp.]
MNITRGKIQSAQKVVIYGPEGIGKSTFAAQFPDPLFIDTEGSTKNMDVARMDKPTSWTMLKNQIAYVKNNSVCKTLVIDTIDWAEQLCIDDICAQYNKKGIEDFGYGNGYIYEKEEFGRFLNSLEDLIGKGINIVLTAHAQLRKFSQPDEFGEYDRWELKLGKKTGSQISPLVKEWADMVLFANYKTVAVAADDKGTKFKAQGGTRVMYTQHHPCWDAKNRFGLSDCIPFDYAQIAGIISNMIMQDPPQPVKPTPSQPQQQAIAAPPQQAENTSVENTTQQINIPAGIPKALADLMRENNVDEKEIRFAVSQRKYYPFDTPIINYDPGFVNGCLIAAWDSVYRMIEDNRDLPF